jgi:predicted O-methyltransferase YrrM
LWLAYLQYLFKAQSALNLHSPFVFQLYTEVINSPQNYYAFAEIEKLRFELLNNPQMLDIQDFGAGSRIAKNNRRSIAHIARYSNTSAKQGRLLFKLVNYFQPHTIVELGTSLGISTLYMAKAKKNARLYTFEGSENVAKIAEENFKKLQMPNIQIIKGNLDEILKPKLAKIPSLDFVFFDANHRLEPTLNYFENCLQKAHNQSVFVFDDIYWSKEMQIAWEKIKAHPKVSLTIDLFWLGLVFFQERPEKQHFVLKF